MKLIQNSYKLKTPWIKDNFCLNELIPNDASYNLLEYKKWERIKLLVD